MRWIVAVATFALGVGAALVLVLLPSDALYMGTGPTTTTDTTPPPPPPPTPDPLFAEIDRALEKLARASVAFNAPRELRKGEPAVIQLLLSLRKPISDLQAELTEIGDREGASVQVSPLVRARLTGFGFTIEALTEPEQPVSPRTDAEWKWEIEGNEAGNQSLHLTLTALIDVDGDRRPRTIDTFDRTIVIHVTWRQRATGFVGDNWQWLWAAILAPLAAVAWGAWTRRRGSRSTTNKPR